MDWMRTLKPDAIIVDPFKVQYIFLFSFWKTYEYLNQSVT